MSLWPHTWLCTHPVWPIYEDVIPDHADDCFGLETLAPMEDVGLDLGTGEGSFPSWASNQVNDQEDRVMKYNTSRVMKHNLILQCATSFMHRRKSGMDDREVLLLSTVLIPDILLATQSMHLSLSLCPLLNLRMRFLLRGEGCNTLC
jgi:hypothetical protein